MIDEKLAKKFLETGKRLEEERKASELASKDNLKDWILETRKKLKENIVAISLISGEHNFKDKHIFYQGKEEIEKALKRCDFPFDAGFASVIYDFNHNVLFKPNDESKCFFSAESFEVIPRNPEKDFEPIPCGGG